MHKEEYDKAKLEKDPKVNDAIHEKVYFTCESCDYKTAYNGDLKKHMQSIHEGITYTYNYCDDKAKQKQRLLVHVDAIHNKVYYSCEVYEYKTGFEEVLRKH